MIELKICGYYYIERNDFIKIKVDGSFLNKVDRIVKVLLFF